MQELPIESYEEFRALMLTHFGREISVEEAKKEADTLLSLMRIVMRPIPKSSITSSDR